MCQFKVARKQNKTTEKEENKQQYGNRLCVCLSFKVLWDEDTHFKAIDTTIIPSPRHIIIPASLFVYTWFYAYLKYSSDTRFIEYYTGSSE